MADLDPFALSIEGVSDLVDNPVNKTRQFGTDDDGGPKYDSLELDMDDEDLLALKEEWENRYLPYKSKMEGKFKRNLDSYLGKRPNSSWMIDPEVPIAANLQFEAEETFLSAALAKNPDPVVLGDDSPMGDLIARTTRAMLQYHADQLVLRRKLAMMVRQWSIYHLGVLKHGWDQAISDIATENRKIQDFVFDPDGHVDAYGCFTSYLGERIKVTAKRLIELFPEHEQYITVSVEGRLGTDVTYTEWWTDEYTFTTYRDKVLAKNLNPYFNYPSQTVDEMGNVTADAGINHFQVPKKPYTFLSVYSLQEQPHDITSNLEQNIPNQNRIRKRTEQIDRNADNANSSYALSQANFNEETGKQAATARARGNPILIPEGGPSGDAIIPLSGQDIPRSIFSELETAKTDLRQSWGILGITTQPTDEDQTARGMILNQQNDSTRIGGGVGDAIEQVADSVFNWWVQLYAVFYDEPHYARVMGVTKSVEFVTLTSQMLSSSVVVSVAPDSMRPKDQITEINLAQSLFDKGVIGPKTLLKLLDFPNPDEAAAEGLLYKVDPMTYLQVNYPEQFAAMQQAMMMNPMSPMNQQQTGAPEENTEPQQNIARNPADASLSQVNLPPLGVTNS